MRRLLDCGSPLPLCISAATATPVQQRNETPGSIPASVSKSHNPIKPLPQAGSLVDHQEFQQGESTDRASTGSEPAGMSTRVHGVTSTRSANAAEANWPHSIHREIITGDGFIVSKLILNSKRKSAFLTISLAQASLYCIIAKLFRIAGWSSPVARQAHNLKVAGSNPAPATNLRA